MTGCVEQPLFAVGGVADVTLGLNKGPRLMACGFRLLCTAIVDPDDGTGARGGRVGPSSTVAARLVNARSSPDIDRSANTDAAPLGAEGRGAVERRRIGPTGDATRQTAHALNGTNIPDMLANSRKGSGKQRFLI